MTRAIVYPVVALFGLAFGSFFNVCVYRLPRDEGLGKRSRCPECGATIRWYDNIPLLSYFALCGRCRSCGGRISLCYPLIEAGTALLFVLVYWWSLNVVPPDIGAKTPRYVSPEFFMGIVFVSVLIIATAVDFSHGIIPNEATYTGFLLMLALVVATSLYRDQPGRIAIALSSGFGAGAFLLAAGLIYGAFFMREQGSALNGGNLPGKPEGPISVNEPETEGHPSDEKSAAESLDAGVDLGKGVSVLKRDEPGIEEGKGQERGGSSLPGESIEETDELKTGIGIGDVKLMTFVGLALGYFHWYLILIALFLGYFAGALVSIALIALKKKSRKDKLPFAPYLALGSFVTLIYGTKIMDLYLSLFR